MLETKHRQKALLLEAEDRQGEKRKQEVRDIKALIQEQKQIQERTTAELCLSLIHI